MEAFMLHKNNLAAFKTYRAPSWTFSSIFMLLRGIRRTWILASSRLAQKVVRFVTDISLLSKKQASIKNEAGKKWS
jgi:hypothetical protein